MLFGKHKMDKKTDEELMLLICDGSEPAFTELYELYAKKILRFMYRMLNNDEEKTQDMLQELFVKIIDNPKRYDSSKAFSSWLYQVAANMCRNEIRNTQNRSRLNQEAILLTDTLDYLPEGMDLSHFKNSYEKIFHTLEDEQQILLTLRFYEDMPLKDIAVVLGIPEGTARSRLFYLLKKFAVLLQEFNPNN